MQIDVETIGIHTCLISCTRLFLIHPHPQMFGTQKKIKKKDKAAASPRLANSKIYKPWSENFSRLKDENPGYPQLACLTSTLCLCGRKQRAWNHD